MENGFIKIQNSGEIDINALLLLGATTKRGDSSKIGYFGSGLKYAIAVMLKNGIDFKIFSGMKEIKVTTVKRKFREKSFDVIKVNNHITSLTTDMGPDWEPWFAIREIYCNALDEGEHVLGLANAPHGEKDKTTIYVQFDHRLRGLFDEWDKYFCDKRQDIEMEIKSPHMKMFRGGDDLIVYRRGVRCHFENLPCLFHYDLSWVDINESRVLVNPYMLKYSLPRLLATSATKPVIKKILNSWHKKYEGEFEWDNAHLFSDDWLEVIADRKIIVHDVSGYFEDEMTDGNFLILPKKLAEALKAYFGKRVRIYGGKSDKTADSIRLEMTPQQKLDIDDAKQFLKKAGIDVVYPISIYQFDEKTIRGQAIDNSIRLSPKAFEDGRRRLIEILLEEYAHLESGACDKTRTFQDFLIGRWVLELEHKTGERL